MYALGKHTAPILPASGLLASFFLTPLLSQLSRRQEFEADAYACRQADGRDLAMALIKLYKDNSSTLTPDPLYVRFYYSHPDASERLTRLRPWFYDAVYANELYDLTIDTSCHAPEEVVAMIETRMAEGPGTAFEQLRARYPLELVRLAIDVGLLAAMVLAGLSMLLRRKKALGLAGEVGVIAPGMAADLAVWDIQRPAELCYWLGKPLLHARYVAGERA